ncbi:arginine--tRNA ligase [Rarobacter faecitabidus]|uniref:Arginine--tRNA ligase n=1 Tax=Rarobacter faecitabidus TaxID=13243 RepID=A0A542ZX82_RARFA|nr:arginine--tRNA ligase [Rarobacter faecitabidus]TQL64958.1 arginyl-tRNA synthetase [Rarobacter faecitabidus]
MTPEELSRAVRDALQAALAALSDTVDAESLPERIQLQRPKQREHGDWSTNIALQLGRRVGLAPRAIADEIAAQLRQLPSVAKAEVAGPGFLNITLDAAAAGELARTIVQRGPDFGRGHSLQGHVINLEYVSANPTGPLHIGHTRWAALGDSLVRLLRAAGADVTAEYYINDAGSQMDKFGESIVARITGADVPEGGYNGAYVAELASKVAAEDSSIATLPREEAIDQAREAGYRLQLAEIRDVLQEFGVHFDEWFSERTLHGSGAVASAVQRLRDQGHVYDEGGAVWLRTTTFGDDKDRVLIKADGSPTYFAADAAYYLSKKDRGYTEKIYLLGADHHGYVGRLKAIAACAGDDPGVNIEILIGQLVSVGGAKLSKRAGNIIELADLIDWIGTDAIRYSLERYPADTPLSLDGEELRKKSNDNPVFYVQYAHARTASVARNAADLAVARVDGFDASLLADSTEATLLALLADYPRIVANAAQLREPHRIARYLEELASAYHKWYDVCRVTPQGQEEVTDTHRTRLWLNDAVGQVLANGLDLLGVSAPERM